MSKKLTVASLCLTMLFSVPTLAQHKCTGESPCSACKNCTACAHCKKEGGTCGTCKGHSKMTTHSTKTGTKTTASKAGTTREVASEKKTTKKKSWFSKILSNRKKKADDATAKPETKSTDAKSKDTKTTEKRGGLPK